jgi:hypothetical protein
MSKVLSKPSWTAASIAHALRPQGKRPSAPTLLAGPDGGSTSQQKEWSMVIVYLHGVMWLEWCGVFWVQFFGH